MKGGVNLATSPITSFQLFCVPWNQNYDHVVDFTNDAQRQTYLASLPHSAEITLAQYVMRNSLYNVNMLFDNCDPYNYIVYDNHEGLGKEYAFILRKRFLNFDTTEITLKEDVWQNNLFSYNIEQAYIEKRHKDRYTSGGNPIFYRNNDLNFQADLVSLVSGYVENLEGTSVLYVGINRATYDAATAQYEPQAGDGCSTRFVPINANNFKVAVTASAGGTTYTYPTLLELQKIMADPSIVSMFLLPVSGVANNTFMNQEANFVADDGSTTISINVLCAQTQSTNNRVTVNWSVPVETGAISVSSLNPANNRNIAYEPKLLEFPFTSYHAELSGGDGS